MTARTKEEEVRKIGEIGGEKKKEEGRRDGRKEKDGIPRKETVLRACVVMSHQWNQWVIHNSIKK